jgi:hypothetical protein
MKHSLLFVLLSFLLSFSSSAISQDTTEYITYDVIHLVDGRILKGTILSFDEEGGGIVFKDTNGRTYSFSRKQYEFFEEDQLFPIKRKKENIEIKPRKENEWEISLGFSAAYLNIQHDFTPDERYVNGVNSLADIPTCFKIGAGKYFNRQHFIGATGEFALFSQNAKYFNFGARYLYQYDGQKRNVAFYVPIELQFNNMEIESRFQTNDTTFFDDGMGYSYPADKDITTSIQSVAFSAGHGFSFIMNNTKSISIEAALVRHFVLSEQHKFLSEAPPKSSFSTTGFRLTLLLNI